MSSFSSQVFFSSSEPIKWINASSEIIKVVVLQKLWYVHNLSSIPVEAVWCLLITLEWCLWLAEQLYDGQLPVATVIIATAFRPWCFLVTAVLYGAICMWPFDADLQLISRRVLLKSLTTQTSRVQPSFSPERWTGGARDASTLPQAPPDPSGAEVYMNE